MLPLAACFLSLVPSPAIRAAVPLLPYPQLISTRYSSGNGLPSGEITAITVAGKRVVAVAKNVAVELDGSSWKPIQIPMAHQMPPGITVQVLPPGERVISWARAKNGNILMVTTKGAMRRRGGRWETLELPRTYKPHQPYPHVDTVVTAVAADNGGTLWIASDHGIYATDGADWWQPINREDGMPYEDMTSVAISPNGDIWGGTAQGAWRLRTGEFRYFWGPRWLPGNRVNAIAVDDKNAAWIATDGGVAKIEERMMTLKDKAAHYEEITALRHNRRGFVTHCSLTTPGEPEKGFVHEASDNDGLWTALYVGAEAFRYAATKDPEARRLAKQSMEALLDLTRLSGVPGYPARAIVKKGEKVYGYNPDETVRIEGETDKIWFESKVNPNILCKGDTSSDELDGHYFAYYIYYELVADEAEKKEMARVVRAITNNIVDHQYTLIGHTGRMTRWGAFGPQFMNDDPRWWEERGLNSSELLCYLKVAHHICGDKKFEDAYNDLIDRHHYLINTLNYRHNPAWYAVNHSDDELAYCVYYPILFLEKDPHRLAILRQTIAQTWLGNGIRVDESPFYNFIYGATTGQPCEVEPAVKTLQDWPWELIHWPVNNSHRHDVSARAAKGERNRVEIDKVLPMSERRTWRWNGDPFEPDEGGNGGNESDGAAFLIGYWMGRYHRIISE